MKLENIVVGNTYKLKGSTETIIVSKITVEQTKSGCYNAIWFSKDSNNYFVLPEDISRKVK